MGEAYLRRRYGFDDLPAIVADATGTIEDFFNFDTAEVAGILRYTFAQVVDQINFDTADVTTVLRYTFAQVVDEINFDTADVITVLRYTFAQAFDQINLDTAAVVTATRFAFAQVVDEINFDTAEVVTAKRFAFAQVNDQINFDTAEVVTALDYFITNISDEFNFDTAAVVSANFPAVLPPTLSNVFNIGPESADITVTNTNDFYTYVYYSITDTTPDTNEPRVLLAPSSFSSGDSFTIGIENNFTLDVNENYTFYARAYDQPLNESSSVVSKNFTTDKYSFEHKPLWISNNLDTTQTSITFAYKNDNDVTAILEVRVLDNSGTQAMDEVQEFIDPDETLTFNSNDYNDDFTAGSTYTFIATFRKDDYYDSDPTENDVTTDSATVFYTVTFKDWDGTTLKTQSVEQGNDASAPTDPSRTGYVFDGWDTTFTNVQSNLTVTAEYLKLYTVTFKDWDGTTLKTQSVAEGSDASAPSDPSRTGYVFTGWDTTFTNVQSNLTVTAEYLIKTLTPITSASGQVTTSEVSFAIENTDSVGGKAQWQIRKNSATGSLEASESNVSIGPSSNASTRVISASATGLDDGTKYVLTNVFVTATDKAKSDEGTEREATTTEITEKPSITDLTYDQSSVSFKLTNNDDATADVYYELDDSTPNEYDVSIGSELSKDKTITGLTANQEYTLYATAEASGKARSGNVSETFTTDPTPQTEKPTISLVSKTDTSITYDIKNEDDSQATIIHEVGTTPPTANSIVVSGGSSTGDITKTGLNASTSYTVYATAQAANEDKSDVASLEITTNDTTYTLRASSSGIGSVDVTIGGTSYSLTTSYQDTATTTSNTTVSLSAPASVTVGGNTYNFADWYDVSSSSSISTNTSATLTWGKASDPLNDKDIEARYIPGGFGF